MLFHLLAAQVVQEELRDSLDDDGIVVVEHWLLSLHYYLLVVGFG